MRKEFLKQESPRRILLENYRLFLQTSRQTAQHYSFFKKILHILSADKICNYTRTNWSKHCYILNVFRGVFGNFATIFALIFILRLIWLFVILFVSCVTLFNIYLSFWLILSFPIYQIIRISIFWEKRQNFNKRK